MVGGAVKLGTTLNRGEVRDIANTSGRKLVEKKTKKKLHSIKHRLHGVVKNS